MAQKTALIAGAAGIIGNAVLRELDAAGWRVRGLSRHALRDDCSIRTELTDADATAAAVGEARDTTNLFYAALAPHRNLATQAARNAAMLGNLWMSS